MATKKEEQRLDSNKRILDAALVEFAANGYKAARLGDIAERAGVTAGLITQRFRTKEDLFVEVFIAQVTRYVSLITDTSSLEACLKNHVQLVKKMANEGDPCFAFLTMVLQNPNSLPQGCKDASLEIFADSKISQMVAQDYVDMCEEDIDQRLLVLLFLRVIVGITSAYSVAGVPLPPVEAYMALFPGFSEGTK